jgi:hypothetical protein
MTLAYGTAPQRLIDIRSGRSVLFAQNGVVERTRTLQEDAHDLDYSNTC